jgi:hypothetical protein
MALNLMPVSALTQPYFTFIAILAGAKITSGSARYQNVSLPASPHSLRFGTTSIQIRVSETPPLF